jgi:methyl-accepting chemotaxis protein
MSAKLPNADEIRLVQESFAKVAPIAEQAAALFYQRLFESEPRLKVLFKGDMKDQGRKLMSMIAAAVKGLGNLDKLVPVVQALGRRHKGYGVKPGDYDAVGAALLWTLEQGLKSAFTPAVRAAWTTVYGVLAATMIEAAGYAPTEARAEKRETGMFRNLSIKTRLVFVISLLSVLLAAIGGLGLFGMSKANDGLLTVYQDRTVPLMDLGLVIDMANRVRTNAVLAAGAKTADVPREMTASVDKLDGEIAKLWDKYTQTSLTAEEKKLVDGFRAEWKIYRQSRDVTLNLAVEGKFDAAKENMVKNAGPKFTAARETLFKLIQLQGEVAKHEYQDAQSRYATIRNVSLTAVALGVLLAVIIGFFLVRAIVRPLNAAIGYFGEIGRGNYKSQIKVESRDEAGKVLEALDAMQHKLDADITAASRVANENLRIKSALDKVASNVMMADVDGNIIYMNETVTAMMTGNEAELRKVLPAFDSKKLIGTSFDVFHKNPAHQRGMLSGLKSTHKAQIKVGPLTFNLIANPVVDAKGERVGTVVEWNDATAELAAREKELRESAENLRIKSALDKVESNVMLADANLNIIYMNETVTSMMNRNEAELKKVLPGFDSRKLIGANIDTFHKNPAHQRGMLANLRSAHKTEIKVGTLTFGLTASPVVDAKGERVGTAVEWRDRTAEVAVEEEVAGIVKAASDGDFTRRIELAGKEGFFKTLAENINGLLQTSSVGLNEVVRVLAALAKGDLTEKITNEYHGTFGQLKDDSNKTVEQLTAIMTQIKESADSISTASSEIAAGNQDLSSRTEEQASSLEETASSMEELTSTVKQNAENAKQANQLAASASDVAVKGGRVVGEVVTTMSSINESSKKIVDIISVIDGIAFQTNILALNAAVEAARAGEQGRGFAVVASEVRNLAQRSAAAAKEIKTLIGDSVEKVGAGTKLVEDAGKTMEEIVNSVKRVTDIMAEITAASQEQSSGIEQVNQAVTQMDQTTQQNAALVEEAAAAAESMKEQAGNLSQAVAVFKLAAGAEHHARPASRPASKLAIVKPAPAARPAAKGGAAPAPQRPAGAKPAKLAANGSGEEAWEEF